MHAADHTHAMTAFLQNHVDPLEIGPQAPALAGAPASRWHMYVGYNHRLWPWMDRLIEAVKVAFLVLMAVEVPFFTVTYIAVVAQDGRVLARTCPVNYTIAVGFIVIVCHCCRHACVTMSFFFDFCFLACSIPRSGPR